MSPFWAWMIGWWGAIIIMGMLVIAIAEWSEKKADERGRASFLWGFYKRDSTDAYVYSSWCWGAVKTVRPHPAPKVEKPTPLQNRAHMTRVEGMDALRDLVSGRITAEEYSKRPPLRVVSLPMPVRVPMTVVAHAHDNPNAPALRAAGGWEDNEEDDD